MSRRVSTKEYPSIRVFKSNFCEWFTHVHPLTPLFFWTPVILVLLWRSYSIHEFTTLEVTGLGMSGFVFWTLAEYMLHRFIFHYEPNGFVQERIMFLIHGIHHEDAKDPTRLVMPPFFGTVLALIFYTLFRLAFGPACAEPFMAFFLMGYLVYDYTHFAVHHFTPRTRFGRFIKSHHMQHHYVNPDSRWGVSSPLWDYVFGTIEGVNRVRHGS
jgi:sterol desaturase/sphingolipid hydroxylase (fatty acid hydroxylase superfamily)